MEYTTENGKVFFSSVIRYRGAVAEVKEMSDEAILDLISNMFAHPSSNRPIYLTESVSSHNIRILRSELLRRQL